MIGNFKFYACSGGYFSQFFNFSYLYLFFKTNLQLKILAMSVIACIHAKFINFKTSKIPVVNLKINPKNSKDSTLKAG